MATAVAYPDRERSPEEAVEVRRFQPGDEAAFRRLNEEWIVRYFALEESDRKVLGDPVEYIIRPGGQIMVAVRGEETLGCCALIPEGHGVYELAKLAVAETMRGQGIGRKLMEFAILEARSVGASKLYLESNSRLPAAGHLYRALGFRDLPPERRKPSLYKRADVFMELEL